MGNKSPHGPMALLLAAGDWHKIDVHWEFLRQHSCAVWRTGDRRTKSLAEIPLPINLYFFHLSVIRYRAHCIEIHSGCDWSLADIPPEFRADRRSYTLYLAFDRLDRVTDTDIAVFPKWRKPTEHFERGLYGLQTIHDVLAATERAVSPR